MPAGAQACLKAMRAAVASQLATGQPNLEKAVTQVAAAKARQGGTGRDRSGKAYLTAASNAVAAGFLLEVDADEMVTSADADCPG